jgi:hypothetical protein
LVKKWNITLNGTHKKDLYWSLDFLNAQDFIDDLFIPKNYFHKLYNCVNNYPNYHYQSCIKRITLDGIDYSTKAMGIILAKPKYYNKKFGILYGELNSGEFKVFAIWEEMVENSSINKDDFKRFINRLIETPHYFKDVSLIMKCE